MVVQSDARKRRRFGCSFLPQDKMEDDRFHAVVTYPSPAAKRSNNFVDCRKGTSPSLLHSSLFAFVRKQLVPNRSAMCAFVEKTCASGSSSEEGAELPRLTTPLRAHRKSVAKQALSKQGGPREDRLPPLQPAAATRGGRRSVTGRVDSVTDSRTRAVVDSIMAEVPSSTAATTTAGQLGPPKQSERVSTPSWEGGVPPKLGLTLPHVGVGTPPTPPSQPANGRRSWAVLAASWASASAVGLEWTEHIAQSTQETAMRAEREAREAASRQCEQSKAAANEAWARGEFAKCAAPRQARGCSSEGGVAEGEYRVGRVRRAARAHAIVSKYVSK